MKNIYLIIKKFKLLNCKLNIKKILKKFNNGKIINFLKLLIFYIFK